MTPAEIEAEAARLRAAFRDSKPHDGWHAVAAASLRARAEVTAERDHLKRREQSIIAACERVADGGRYRADIVGAIQRLRRERDEARAVADAVVEAVERYEADPEVSSSNSFDALRHHPAVEAYRVLPKEPA